MFSRTEPKPRLRVIAVKVEDRDITEENEESSSGYGMSSRHTKTKRKMYKHKITQVLCTRGDDLFVKEFNGKWDLSDVKKWEDTNQ